MGGGPVPGGWPADLPHLSVALADDDENENQSDDDDDRPAPMRDFGALARSLKIGSVWVERRGTQGIAVQVSLERAGVVVGSLTLDPATLEPVSYLQQRLARPSPLPSTAQLRAVRIRLATQLAGRMTSGRFAAAGSRGPQLPLYWAGRHVTYLSLDVYGSPQPDTATRHALMNSLLRVY